MGTKVTHGKSLKSIEKVEKFAIIMGNEGNGVREEILDICDEYLYLLDYIKPAQKFRIKE